MKAHLYVKRFLAVLTPIIIAFVLPIAVNGQIYNFSNTYKGSEEVPANASAGTGTISGTYNSTTNVITYTITFSGLGANTSNAHFHSPAFPGVNAGVLIGHPGFPLGVTSGSLGTTSHTITNAQEVDLLAGKWYSNIHTTALPGGEIRAQIFFGAPFVAPVVTCPADIVVSNAAGLCSQSVSFAASATGSPAPAFLYKIGPTVITSPYVFPVGTSTVSVWALNGGGVATCSFKVTVNDATNPVINCPANITVFNDPGVCGAVVRYTATGTDNCTGVLVTTIPASGSLFPVGTSIVTAKATDATGNISTCTFNVTVIDNEVPVISGLKADPDKLWPPNHKMRDVNVNYSSQDNCSVLSCALTVTSNESDNGTGDGNTTGDWVVIDDHHVQLRAERAGTGNDRIYTITTTCTDQYGNSSSSATTVVVPHDMGNGNGNGNSNGNGNNKGGKLMGFISPNPANSIFNLSIETENKKDRIDVRVTDHSGRTVEFKNNLFGSQNLRLGNSLKEGIYFVVISQGGETTQLKLIKTK